MYERILVPLDGSAASERVLGPLQRLCRKTDAELILVQVVEPHPGDVGPGFEAESVELALDYLKQVADALPGIRTRVKAPSGAAAATLVALAREERATLIALATHGRTASDRVPYGGVAERLLRTSPVPVLAVPSLAKARDTLRRILVPIDGGEPSRAIAPYAAALAELSGAELLLLHVGQVEPDTAGFPGARVLVEPGDPAGTILAVAEREEADMIAMSTRLGQVAREVLRRSGRPLLIARAA